MYKSKINEPIYNTLIKTEEFSSFVSKKQINNNEENYEDLYKNVVNSKTFKIGNAILFIPRKIKNIFNH